MGTYLRTTRATYLAPTPKPTTPWLKADIAEDVVEIDYENELEADHHNADHNMGGGSSGWGVEKTPRPTSTYLRTPKPTKEPKTTTTRSPRPTREMTKTPKPTKTKTTKTKTTKVKTTKSKTPRPTREMTKTPKPTKMK